MAELAHDTIEQILIASDVKDLIRFKCVCKSWNALQNEGTGTLCNGALHLLMKDQDNNHTILSFDLSKEEFKEIPLPAAFPQFDSWEEFPLFSGDNSSKEHVVFRHDRVLARCGDGYPVIKV
uniref:F-box domain-containing protein n=1 Tax=Tanacetum cinerariifolium TaxID=118510 RepID=A0A699GTG2_TANCI|nr:hypothetical protein [Tanacetum cinerariifolium]